VFAAPLIIVACGFIKSGNLGDAIMLFAFGAITGMVFSIPSALLFWLSAYIITRQEIAWAYKKVILSVIGIALTLLAFMLYADGAMPGRSLLTYLTVYATVIVAGVWIYKLKPIMAAEPTYPIGKEAIS
jgi:hypothetical protein